MNFRTGKSLLTKWRTGTSQVVAWYSRLLRHYTEITGWYSLCSAQYFGPAGTIGRVSHGLGVRDGFWTLSLSARSTFSLLTSSLSDAEAGAKGRRRQDVTPTRMPTSDCLNDMANLRKPEPLTPREWPHAGPRKKRKPIQKSRNQLGPFSAHICIGGWQCQESFSVFCNFFSAVDQCAWPGHVCRVATCVFAATPLLC